MLKQAKKNETERKKQPIEKFINSNQLKLAELLSKESSFKDKIKRMPIGEFVSKKDQLIEEVNTFSLKTVPKYKPAEVDPENEWETYDYVFKNYAQ